jgi:hypothetical protein
VHVVLIWSFILVSPFSYIGLFIILSLANTFMFYLRGHSYIILCPISQLKFKIIYNLKFEINTNINFKIIFLAFVVETTLNFSERRIFYDWFLKFFVVLSVLITLSYHQTTKIFRYKLKIIHLYFLFRLLLNHRKILVWCRQQM